jgi:hypothetical protein
MRYFSSFVLVVFMVLNMNCDLERCQVRLYCLVDNLDTCSRMRETPLPTFSNFGTGRDDLANLCHSHLVVTIDKP